MTAQRALIPAAAPSAASPSLTQTRASTQRAANRSHATTTRRSPPVAASNDQPCGWKTVGILRRSASRPARPELSNASGLVVFTLGVEEGKAVHYIAFERGRTLDEYLSVPDFRGPLPPGDAIALRANPTVVARLTGASPAGIRSVARTAASPDELPPADELLRELALALGLEGTHIRFDEARYLPDAVVVEHE
jgi:hypothetical protein